MTSHLLVKGAYRARLATSPADIEAAQRLRHASFRGQDAGNGLDHDRFDPVWQHLLIENTPDGTLAGCCRFHSYAAGDDLSGSYSAQFYDLAGLGAQAACPTLEIGRFCLHPNETGMDALRVAWGALTQVVEAGGIGFLFGCSSFAGTDPAPYAQAFAQLARSHLGPVGVRPGPKSARRHDFAAIGITPDLRRALSEMPPMLRSYLTMGGWVSDHAVIDDDMGTLHVFTGVEVARIPAARARALRALVQEAD